jgi:acetyl esterase/lipase
MRRVLVLFVTAGLGAAGLWASTPAAQPPGSAKAPPAPPPSLEAVLGKDTVAKKDIAYGTDEKQKLDVYSPKDAKGRPVVVYIHGGEWTKGDKSEVSYKPKFFTENGIVFASMNYRLSPAAKHPAHVSDVAAAVRWLTDHVAEYGGDPKKMVLMGHSAGCHLVVLTTLDPQYLEAVKLKPADLRGVVAWSGGSFDLVHKAKVDESFAEYIRNAFGTAEDGWKAASPVSHARNAKACPPYLFVTADPTGDSFKIAEGLVKQINDAGGKATTHVLKDRTHRTANHLLGSPDDKTGAALLDFVRELTK